MWDDPIALNRISRIILAATALYVLWVAGRAVLEMGFPFRQVTVHGAAHDATQASIQPLVRRMSGGFFSMNLEAVQDDFQTLPWVRRVDVHRVWPGRLVVTLQEHKPAAAWNDRASLNDHGEVFPVEPGPNLPRVYAPDGMEKLVTRRFVEFSQIVSPLDVRVEQVVVSARQSWRVRLTGGITVELGRERINERLGRFAQAYPQALAAVGPFQRADMRYPNGFAAQVESRGTTANKASKA
ncbi:MAG: FtsQ-type POTRA domain-containing protein [Thiobacillus sp.]|nr:FtsQ-type POTRA domain-containing protein [Thiobacillus sp.]